MTSPIPTPTPTLTALAGLVEALEEIAKPHGVLCLPCGGFITECDLDNDPDRCPGKLARGALAVWRTRVPMAEDEQLRWALGGVVLRDLNGRSGIGNALEEVDVATLVEIKDTLGKKVAAALDARMGRP